MPAAQEQPRLRGRAGRRQDRDRRGARAEAARGGGPEALKGAEIFALDTGALLAGTRYRGDFEERFKAVIQALKKRPLPVLFIDEMHTMVGAGATTGGTMDLANLIKPILTEGEIRLMGSTTFEEFKHIEKDRALARRVQRIDVDEPNEGDTVRILQGLRAALRGAPQGHATPTGRSRWRRASPGGTCATRGCPTARST